MSAIGQPDYQRGVSSAQLLLASVPAGTDFVVVGVPPNAETLVVVLESRVAGAECTCVGVTTGLDYPGLIVVGNAQTNDSISFFFDVTQVMDQQVRVTIPTASASSWFVYADAGVHLFADISNLRNFQGMQYVVPSAPGTDTLDHPPNELQYTSAGLNGSAALVASPGAGKRIRLFSAQMCNADVVVSGYLFDTVVATPLIYANQGSGVAMTYGPTGVPLTANAGLSYHQDIGGGFMICIAVYTVETV